MGKQKHDPPVPTWVRSASCLILVTTAPMMVLLTAFDVTFNWGVAASVTIISGSAISLAFGKSGWVEVINKLPWRGNSDR